MQIIEDIQEIRQLAIRARSKGQKIALVPTMGFLHQGHLSLVRAARKHAQIVIVSIFLNPTQFNEASDYEKYPRDLKRDLELLGSEQVEIVFCPKVSDIYRPNSDSWVSVEALSRIHEGEFRPGHFRGVTTIVNMLFNIVGPDLALFGEKDFQQLGLIRKMVEDLHIPVEVLGCETLREQDGLAMSSRNARLSKSAREHAPYLFRALQLGAQKFIQGQTSARNLEIEMENYLAQIPSIKMEYIRVIDPLSFERRMEAKAADRIVLAAWIDGVRLIDNIAL